MPLQFIEAVFPKRAPLGEPFFSVAQHLRFQLARADTTFFECTHQLGIPKNLQMLIDGGQRHIEGFSQLRDRSGTLAEAFDNRAPRRITKRPKDLVGQGILGKIGHEQYLSVYLNVVKLSL